jgi:hypothetical protein
MTPYTIITWCIIAATGAAVLPYIIGKRALRKKSRLGASSAYGHRSVYESPALKAARERFREGGTITPRATPFISTGPRWGSPCGRAACEPNLQNIPVRTEDGLKIRRTFIASPGHKLTRRKSIFLTARELEHVNIKRRLSGKPPLTRAGFTNAAALAWDRPERQPDTVADWLTYLTVYECSIPGHTSPRTSVDTGLTITPDAPYNGHWGEYTGAGTIGDWTSPDAQALGSANVGMGAALDRDGNSLHDGSLPPPGNPGPWPTQDPSPSYSPNASSGAPVDAEPAVPTKASSSS